jgi:hypothetical protein
MIFKKILFFICFFAAIKSSAETYNVTTKSEALAAIESIMARVSQLSAIDPAMIQSAQSSVEGLNALLNTPGMIIPVELEQQVAEAKASAQKYRDYLNSIPNVISERTRFMQIRESLVALINTLADPVVAPQITAASLTAATTAADTAVRTVSASIASTLQIIADAKQSFDSLVASPLLSGKVAPLSWQ